MDANYGKHSVKKCEDGQKKIFALKIVRRPAARHHFGSARKAEYMSFRNEVDIWKTLDHPNVVRLYEVIDDESINKMYLVMEYLSGGTIEYADAEGHPLLDMKTTKRYFKELMSALAYLHNLGIIHRDIKPENLLLSGEGHIKICDFGSAQASSISVRRTMGSPAFFAPELFLDGSNGYETQWEAEDQLTGAVDVWAAGITLYLFVYGHTPFEGLSMAELQRQVLNNYLTFPWEVDPMCQSIILECLQKSKADRIEAYDVLECDWFQMKDESEVENCIANPYVDWLYGLLRAPLKVLESIWAITKWVFFGTTDDDLV
ncbi:CAMKK protein kinase [Sphaeroforma arctica JP610]|uniref:CAMKK protein kinase n=1 Tax=Sphaeroforma arctica JP610 TaxID=667725 RepID=A0A0L0G427_9EUKA|nr:CAMKK protein kinase [Sphaeroforma arctica JP610]KNC83867.1 CAMKK protein kinase [Sphaeroforma arctica JP610]|eukprot:XP_014157769.1 CAMKK protein kinase [Sphaeroforma arctica JP610]